MRDAAHEVGEISDTVGKMTAELFEMNHFESLFLGPMMIEDFSPWILYADVAAGRNKRQNDLTSQF